jgi:hypothetical protein
MMSCYSVTDGIRVLLKFYHTTCDILTKLQGTADAQKETDRAVYSGVGSVAKNLATIFARNTHKNLARSPKIGAFSRATP